MHSQVCTGHKTGGNQSYMQGRDCHPEGRGQQGWTLCSLGRRNGQPCPGLADSGSDAGRAGDQGWGKVLGADGQRAEQGPGLHTAARSWAGVNRAEHGVSGHGGVMPSARDLSGLTQDTASRLGPHTRGMSANQRGSGETSGTM